MKAKGGSGWEQVKKSLGRDRLLLGPYFSYQFTHSPRRILHAMSYYKFAAKTIGPGQSVLEIGCSEGLGTLILAETACDCLGIDTDREAVKIAGEAFSGDKLRFRHADIFTMPPGRFNAAVSLDVIEHIPRRRENAFIAAVKANLDEDGIFIVGTPNSVSSAHASAVTRQGHINLYDAQRLKDLLKRHFEGVLLFCANDEVVHTGFTHMAHYLIGVGIIPKAAGTGPYAKRPGKNTRHARAAR